MSTEEKIEEGSVSAPALGPPLRERWRTPFKTNVSPKFDVGDRVIGVALPSPISNPSYGNLPAPGQLVRVDDLKCAHN